MQINIIIVGDIPRNIYNTIRNIPNVNENTGTLHEKFPCNRLLVTSNIKVDASKLIQYFSESNLRS